MASSLTARVFPLLVAALLLAPLHAAAQGPRLAATTDPGPRLLGVPVAEPAPDLEAEPDASAAAAEAGEERVEEHDATRLRRSAIFGYSGKLRAMVVADRERMAPTASAVIGAGTGMLRWYPFFGGSSERVLGEPVPSGSGNVPEEPGIFMVEAHDGASLHPRTAPIAVIAGVPFTAKKGAYLNGYHVGRYPVEGSGRADRYGTPQVFIEVTPENQDFNISEHFKLRQFLTKDQFNVWPKYLVLDLRLIDKLELVLAELNAMGVRADRMHVMSGYRTPQYNGPGGDGRALLSRHTYGDAADVWVDNDGDGYMDDLDGDGRADSMDARVILRAVERVEEKYPQLIGGAGVYVANGARGPFIHIDVRGNRARW